MSSHILRIVLENVDFRLPTQVTDDNSVLALKSLVFEPLIQWQPNGDVLPGLFDRWEVTGDNRVWHFHIRDDAVFHDGKQCDAELVVDYIKGFLDSHDYFGMAWSYSRYFAKTVFTAEGDRVVKVEHPEPFADLLNVLNDFWPSRIAADGKPVLGTGPYRVVEFERRDNVGRAVLERLDSANKEWPQTIIATAARNGEDRLKLLQKGEVDAALNLERVDDLPLVDFKGNLQWGRVLSTLSVIYYLNCPSGIFSSPEIRYAANLAIDNDALVERVYLGLAAPAATVVSPHHLGFKESGLKPIPYDPNRAREIIKDLDLSKPLRLRTPEWMPEHAEKITDFVKASLEAVGFNVEVEVETDRPEYARSIGLKKNIGDLACFDSTPNTTFRVLDDKVSSASHGTWWLGYDDDEFQRLFTNARKTVLGEARKEAYGECLRRLHDNPPWLYIAHPDVIWATRPGVSLSIGPSGILKLGQNTAI
ncbi:unnamed protein product [Clonostachys byssicola]|uniref:Solute-binding protein family 5 domain-containing protein n=1 Tax=Clonostachys byssicola TaxID=160290 RepID=A0A9N9U926_9HYPO|nr:unnamed protein product [Clonostachys byssicola]